MSERPRVAAVALDDEERRRLLAAPVAAGRLRRREALEQALGERRPAVASNVVGERVDGRRRDEDVPLRGVAVAHPAARPVEALRRR